eukprot:352421-Chlamydomonas_euryale.AAC.87
MHDQVSQVTQGVQHMHRLARRHAYAHLPYITSSPHQTRQSNMQLGLDAGQESLHADAFVVTPDFGQQRPIHFHIGVVCSNSHLCTLAVSGVTSLLAVFACSKGCIPVASK